MKTDYEILQQLLSLLSEEECIRIERRIKLRKIEADQLKLLLTEAGKSPAAVEENP